MVHVLLRISVWVFVLGIAYLIFGSDLFDSSREADLFEGKTEMFLPPVKSKRHFEFDEIMKDRGLNADELAEYRALVQERESKFWHAEGVSVREALSGVNKRRKERLAAILEQRGATKDEAAIFLLVLERDHPALLADQD
jgi:hypothetical protein